jgi:hypothetical protein
LESRGARCTGPAARKAHAIRLARRAVPEFNTPIPSFAAPHNLSGDAISMIHRF